MSDIVDGFNALRPSTSRTEFEALSLSGDRADFLAKGPDGKPIFLLQEKTTDQYQPGLHLRYLDADFQMTCRLEVDQGHIEDVFAIVACTADEPELYELFIRSLDAAREQISKLAATQEIRTTVQNLASLFRSLAGPNSRSIIGLWAELFVIQRSGSIPHSISMWRGDASERFDFSTPTTALEVKATVGISRSHEFNLEQLTVPKNGAGYVVSLLLQPINGGTSILELAANVERELTPTPHLRTRLWENIVGDLGNDFGASLDKRFDESYAERNLQVFAMDDIPKPGHRSDPRVTSIRFIADCTGLISSTPHSDIGGLRAIFESS